MKKTDISWAAGVVDGEGCISATSGKGTINLQVSMCDVSVVWRLHKLFGGTVSKWIERPHRRPFRRYSVCGKDAMKAIAAMAPWLSFVKLKDYAHALTIAPHAGKGAGWRQKKQTHCENGHRFDKENTYHHRGFRHCRACRKKRLKKWYDAHKHTKFWQKYR